MVHPSVYMIYLMLCFSLFSCYWFLVPMCLSDSYGLGELYEEWYTKRHLERDFVKVSKDQIESTSLTGKSLDHWTQHSLHVDN